MSLNEMLNGGQYYDVEDGRIPRDPYVMDSQGSANVEHNHQMRDVTMTDATPYEPRLSRFASFFGKGKRAAAAAAAAARHVNQGGFLAGPSATEYYAPSDVGGGGDGGVEGGPFSAYPSDSDRSGGYAAAYPDVPIAEHYRNSLLSLVPAINTASFQYYQAAPSSSTSQLHHGVPSNYTYGAEPVNAGPSGSQEYAPGSSIHDVFDRTMSRFNCMSGGHHHHHRHGHPPIHQRYHPQEQVLQQQQQQQRQLRQQQQLQLRQQQLQQQQLHQLKQLQQQQQQHQQQQLQQQQHHQHQHHHHQPMPVGPFHGAHGHAVSTAPSLKHYQRFFMNARGVSGEGRCANPPPTIETYEKVFPPLPKASRPRNSCVTPSPLDLPDILLCIFEFVADNNDIYRCLFVNRMWCINATRILWQRAQFNNLDKATMFLSLFDPMKPQGSSSDDSGYNGVEPLAVLSGHQPCIDGDMKAKPGPSKMSRSQKKALKKRKERYEVLAASSDAEDAPFGQRGEITVAMEEIAAMSRATGSSGIDESHLWRMFRHRPRRCSQYPPIFLPSARPHQLYAHSMRKLVFYKLKTLESPLLISAASRLPKLTYLEFYICDIITTAVVSAFARNCPLLRDVKVPGCGNVTDEAVAAVAVHCPRLHHLDVRACSLISDRGICEVASRCIDLVHLNVGRINGGERITYRSISEIAVRTQVDTLGLAGCDITDNTVLAIALYRSRGLERVSLNNCPKITDKSVMALVQYCPRLAVLEIKECALIVNFGLIWKLMQKRVLVELCATGRVKLDRYQKEVLSKINFNPAPT